MPYQHIKYKIPPSKDKRVKLTDDQRAEIKKLYGTISQRKLAKAYGVSRRLIIFIGDPDKYKENKQRRKERGGSTIYYQKERHTQAMKKHRRHKQTLFLNNQLEPK